MALHSISVTGGVDVDCKVPLSSPSTAAPPGGFREHCLSNAIDSGVTSCAAPRWGEEHRGPRGFCAASDGGVLSFGYFALHKQRKVTRGAGAERPQLAFKARAAARHHLGQTTHPSIQPALLTRGVVLVNNALGGGLIETLHSHLEGFDAYF